ncbi:MAG: alpha/beta fold hydrolase [Candidatus Sericytochromatia bacterium]
MPDDSRPNLRPVRDVAPPSLHFRMIHGYRRAFRMAGSGPALLLIHGVGDDSTTWGPVHARLAQRFTVIAPDLLGHGESDKPRADYSLAAFANGMRDLLAILGHNRVTVVGHSLGGGIAMQMAYQYPHLIERIVLVGSGGVTTDVSIALRLAALPLGSEALSVLRAPGVLPALKLAGPAVGSVFGSNKFTRDLPDAIRLLIRLQDKAALSAFSRTLRAVVDGRGQLVTMLDRSYLMQSIPLQLIWGEDDLIIPVSHATLAHEKISGSRLAIFENSGHMPFHDHPGRFADVVERFVEDTQPAEHDPELNQTLLCTGTPGFRGEPVELPSYGA